MKKLISIVCFFFCCFIVNSQTIGLSGPTNVCLGNTDSYSLIDGVSCHGSGTTRWQLDIEVIGGTIVDFTTVDGTVIAVGSSTLNIEVRRTAINNACADVSTPAQAISCANAIIAFNGVWISSFNVNWDDYNRCDHQIFIKKRDQFRFFGFWFTGGCQAESTLNIEMGLNNGSTTTPTLWLPNLVCAPDCDNMVRICATSCHDDPFWHAFNINSQGWDRANECIEVPWEPNADGTMNVCVSQTTNCGTPMNVCKNIGLYEPEIIGSLNPTSCYAYYELSLGILPCIGNIDPSSVQWNIWTTSWGANLTKQGHTGVYVEFNKNGIYTLQACYETLCGEIKCITTEIVVEFCEDNKGQEFTETNSENRSSGSELSQFTIVNNLVKRGEDITINYQNYKDNKLTLYDISGMTYSLDLDKGGDIITVSTQNLESGMYFISDGCTSAKIVVQ